MNFRRLVSSGDLVSKSIFDVVVDFGIVGVALGMVMLLAGV